MRGESLVSGALARQMLRRYWPVWLGVACSWLLFCVMPLASGLSTVVPDFEGVSDDQAQLWNSARAGVVFLVFALSLLVTLFLNERLFSPKAATFYGSAPIARRTLFATTLLVSLAVQVAVVAVVALLLLALVAGIPSIGPGAVGAWFAFAVACTLVETSFAQLASEISGRPAVAAVLYVVANVVVVCVVLAVEFLCEALLYGALLPDASFAEWFSPVVGLAAAAYDQTVGGGVNWLPVGVYCLVGVALLALSRWLDGRRDAETAGETVSFAALAPVLKYLAGICAALLLSSLVYLFFFRGIEGTAVDAGGAVALAASLVVGGFLGLLFAQISIDKSAHVLGRIWKGGAVLAAVAIVGMAVLAFDPMGIVERVPDADDVRDVEVAVYSTEAADLSSPEGIESVRVLHREIVSTREDRAAEIARADGSYSDITLGITYHLKDGGTMMRQYVLRYPYNENADGGSDLDYILDGPSKRLMERANAIIGSDEAKLSLLAGVRAGDPGYEVSIYIAGGADADAGADGSDGGDLTYTLAGDEARAFVEDAMVRDIAGIRNEAAVLVYQGETPATEYDATVQLLDAGGGNVLGYSIDSENTPATTAWVKTHYPAAHLHYWGDEQ